MTHQPYVPQRLFPGAEPPRRPDVFDDRHIAYVFGHCVHGCGRTIELASGALTCVNPDCPDPHWLTQALNPDHTPADKATTRIRYTIVRYGPTPDPFES